MQPSSAVVVPSGDPLKRLSGHRIELRGVSSGYHQKRVLEDITFTVEEPAIYVVLGPNGAGKTTLFRTLAGILQPTEGEVLIGDEPVDHQTSRDQLHFLS